MYNLKNNVSLKQFESPGLTNRKNFNSQKWKYKENTIRQQNTSLGPLKDNNTFIKEKQTKIFL